MKLNNIFLGVTLLGLLFSGCDKENNPEASGDLGITGMFGPKETDAPIVKELYKNYGLWVRMDFTDPKEVGYTTIAQDPWGYYGTTLIEEANRESALVYTKTLMSNVPEVYANHFFPLEFFFVKMYGAATNVKQIGRSRLVIAWPSQLEGALPVADPEKHYYQDSVLATAVWAKVGNMVALRFEEPLNDFVAAGKAYDDGAVFDKIEELYEKDSAMLVEKSEEFCRASGYIYGSGSYSFATDFGQWLNLLAVESYDNIKKNYLDNSPMRTAKYNIIVKHFKDNGWDIQATGNKYREKYNEYKASL